MSLDTRVASPRRKKLIYASAALFITVTVVLGIFANNGWLPSTDAVRGQKTGWSGQKPPKTPASTWNPFAAPTTSPTPQLSKENIYAGSRLLAVEDKNASAVPPSDLA